MPGVTTVLQKTVPKPALTYWAARMAAEYALDHWDQLVAADPSDRYKALSTAHDTKRDAAAARGTEVHRLAAQLADDVTVAVPDELAGHVEAYRDWLDRFEVAPVDGGSELVVASRALHYCGTTDLIADLPDIFVDGQLISACRWLLELKTTASGVWPESALQATAYRRADVFGVVMDPCGACDPESRIVTGPRGGLSKCEACHPERAGLDERPMDWLKIARCGVVWIKSDTCELRPVDTSDDVWEYFTHLRWLYDHQDDMPGWIGSSAEAVRLLAAAAP